MKSGTIIIIAGGVMILFGLILFYGMQGVTSADPDEKKFFSAIKHTGTFTGLLGIGVSIAGFLLYLMNRKPAPIIEDYGNSDLQE
ncbi:MAG: hypothetical protein KGZ34_00235 [Nitrosarchaeum sp.]|nr:hypothetical protein [Nitrosarchaeum sp.]